MKHEGKIYNCECHEHKLEYEVMDDMHFLTFWTHGTEGDKPSFVTRLAEAWRVLTGKKLQGFWGVILDKDEIQKLADDINESKNADI